jgi:hypothetical protein
VRLTLPTVLSGWIAEWAVPEESTVVTGLCDDRLSGVLNQIGDDLGSGRASQLDPLADPPHRDLAPL